MKKHICLLMMVRNEQDIIGRAIASALPYVDSVIVVDTGSTDKTAEKAFAAAREKPITIYNADWKGFGPSRTEALDFAKRAYEEGWLDEENNVDGLAFSCSTPKLEDVLFLTLDADDEIISFPEEIPVEADCYTAVNRFGTLEYPQIRLLRGDVPFVWQGSTHEALCCETHDAHVEPLPGFVYRIGNDSARRKSGRKSSDDIELLRVELQADPENTRAWFYLGNCHQDSGEELQAIEAYSRRVQLQGFDEEIYLSWVRMGECQARLGCSDDAMLCWLRAIECRPWRAEAYTNLAEFTEKLGLFHLAALWAKLGRAKGKEIPKNDRLFVDAGCAFRCQGVIDRLPPEIVRDLCGV